MRRLILILALPACAADHVGQGFAPAPVDAQATADAQDPTGEDATPAPDIAPRADAGAPDQVDTGGQDAAPRHGDDGGADVAVGCAEECVAFGRCTPTDGGCSAVLDADCVASWGCEKLGHCTALAGKCVLASDHGCSQLHGCTALGLCTWSKPAGACVAYWEGDCLGADVCVAGGKCTPKGGQCVDG